ncbi:MAG: NAD(P)-dependent oxidoreductase [Rhodospirillaceae bacterium]|jgi:dTDP-4-dehydrorhamnose reductase|nr:NAD(P)-dependent oxidoreductase [Rhodospirillaceae bacterium]MBT5245554.1 NAD(P)-dependent oxidoreductase [Rhodospirillaceae bacterium]MBT5561036.1 NAD(P)-dependent oxidoreductase [Rhodospirillaceae bacterium]MBT6240672.1 NAD(P)-dependent oxidoreductase [Rhodospirillaceae bacterium]
MKFLLFGSSGCFGTAFEAACASRNVDFTGLSHQDIDILNHGDVEALISKQKPDVIINSVAMVGINPCEEDPGKAFALHATAALNMIKESAAINATFIQTSSHAVFDGSKDEPYTEDDTPRAGNVYAVSKYAAEMFASTWCPKHYVVRFPTMYGPRRNASPGFVDKVLQWIDEGRELQIAHDKIDSPTYVKDAAEAVLELALNKRPYGTYHIANEGIVSYFDFIKQLAALLGASNKVHPVKDADFPSLAPKALKTSMRSIKLEPLRLWNHALEDYVENELK